ncbi:MAG TPA: J domain-containing protein [Solirubrobacteraceae bacterium]
MDPFDVLGVAPGAPPDELAAAYRRAAKRWHPDRGGGEDAQRRMAEINAAYDLLRDGGWRSAMAEAMAPAAKRGGPPAPARPRPKGSWLAEDVRRALGGELIAALRDGEKPLVITPAATWASPTTLLVLTDQRLVWLLDDAIGQRVQALPIREITDVGVGRGRLRRDVAALKVRSVRGRRLVFSELRPDTAEDLLRRISHMREAV